MNNEDYASELEQREREAVLMNRQKPIEDTGFCFNCSEKIIKGKFCDSDCRDDYERRRKRIRH